MAATRPIRQEPEKPEKAGPSIPAPPPRLTPLREMQLLDAHRRGGQEAHAALSELLQSYQRRVYSICFRMVKNVDDASELTQDVLVRMIEGLESYDGRSKLSTWVIRIAMNACLTHIRKRKLRQTESVEGSQGARKAGLGNVRVSGEGAGSAGSGGGSGGGFGGAGVEVPSREQTPAEGVEQQEKRSAVLRALEGLDADMRAILVLRDMQDLDYQQLAEALEVPVGTVKSRLFRARAALREAIEKTESGKR